MPAQRKSFVRLNRVRNFRSRKNLRNKKRLNEKPEVKNKLITIFKWSVLLLLFSLVIIFFFSRTKYWNGKTKISIVVNAPPEGVEIITFDPKSVEISEILIPGDTLIDVARGLGSWRVKSIWKLGENEGAEGQLMAETVSRYFKIPVYLWGDRELSMLSEKNLFKLVTAAFAPTKTNLPVGDRLRIALFNLKVKNGDRKKIDLLSLGYLKSADLPDGGKGYVTSGKFPKELLGTFSIEDISNSSLMVEIKDNGESTNTSQKIGELVEVLGAKVVSVDNGSPLNNDCEVWGKNNILRKNLILLFSCKDVSKNKSSAFDLTIQFGTGFEKRF